MRDGLISSYQYGPPAAPLRVPGMSEGTLFRGPSIDAYRRGSVTPMSVGEHQPVTGAGTHQPVTGGGRVDVSG